MNKWIALTGLYVAQGLPHGFFGQAMPVLLREQGLDLRLIGLLSLVAIPWALKFLWAPWLDRYSLVGHEYRRSWILLMNAAAVVVLLVLSVMDISDWLALGIVWPLMLLVLLNLFIATQDIATDAMAVENLNAEERGKGNGLQVAAYRVGMIVSGGVLVSLFGSLGWSYSLWLLAGLLLLGSLPLWWFAPKPHTRGEGSMAHEWLDFFRQKDALLWLVLLSVYKFGDAFGTPMIRPMMSDAGVTLEQMGWLLGTVGFAAGLLGALAGGWLVGVLGRQFTLMAFLLLEAFALLAYIGVGASTTFDWVHLVSAVLVEHVAGGMGTAALFTVMMDRCREHCAAADYALQSCVVIVTGMIAGGLSGISAHALGYDGHFLLSAVLCVLVMPLIWNMIRRGDLPARGQA
ncbi:MFS transporter [Thalassolituus sp. LLYu03]|uniref:MFS transporter n=1 Tax=Thalassolituus sp. LLYu03 TaxID=3421656 RepID=UPI003D2A0701